ncbi:hypothetical protein ABZX90_16445 [Streptomyces sp. NPDC002935]|uniref:hypothetical protein n=1 Tax=Streptomyces sp. NPDC002935 TaxID=3154545 RepID=UPI0033A6FF83
MSWQSGDPEARPKVYLPQSDGETPPAYETYTDPAEAHGWRKAYTDGGDTAVLNAVSADPAGRHERLLRRRRARLTRRLAVAGGAAGVVVLGVVVAGAFDSGAADGPGGTPLRTNGPVRLATGPAEPDEGSTGASSAQPSATTSASTAAASAGDASPSATTTAGASKAPAPSASTAPTTSAAPTPTASATGGRGHGHGRGGSWPK